jgi:uncharacterized membrane protein YbaN (DUF454 family)
MWRPKTRVGRWALTVLGGFFVILGAIGVFVPGLPTTIFLIVACFAFARSCPAMETWIRSRAWTQPFLPYLDGHRLPKRLATRILLIILASVVLAISLLASLWARVLVGVLAAVGMLSVTLRSEWTGPSAKPARFDGFDGVHEAAVGRAEDVP